MMKRLKLAARVLFGLPLKGVRVGEEFLLEKEMESEFDHTKVPPFDLAFGGVVECYPPEVVFRGGRFRVCVFPEKDRKKRWLVMELEGHGKWHQLAAMHEANLAVMLGVLGEAKDFLEEYRRPRAGKAGRKN